MNYELLTVTLQSLPSLETEATYEPSALHQRGGKYFNTKPADESRLEKLFSLGKAFFKSAVALQYPNKEVNFMGHEHLMFDLPAVYAVSRGGKKNPSSSPSCGLRAIKN